MTANWLEIKRARTDMSEYVMHCTRARFDGSTEIPPYDVLKEILTDGFLRATFVIEGRSQPGVRGPFPAVCFTEQPLGFFIQSVAASWARYTEFAIAVRKDDLACYGGAPAIYGAGSYLYGSVTKGVAGAPPWVYSDGLPTELQYLWVAYDPTKVWNDRYPLDWTHEREWRARPSTILNAAAGLRHVEAEAVPIALPTQRTKGAKAPAFIVLVDSEARRNQLAVWIRTNAAGIACRGEYWASFAKELCGAPILSFEAIKSALAVNGSLGRLDDYYPTWEE